MDASGLRQITLLFYANGNGGEPVRGSSRCQLKSAM